MSRRARTRIWEVRALGFACAGVAVGALLAAGGELDGRILYTVVPRWVLLAWGLGAAAFAEMYVRWSLLPAAAKEQELRERVAAIQRRRAALGMVMEGEYGEVWAGLVRTWNDLEQRMPARADRRYGVFARAAHCYLARYVGRRGEDGGMVPEQWPLTASAWVPGWAGNRNDVVRAAAFLICELVETDDPGQS